MILLGGYLNGALWILRENIISGSVGHIQLQRSDYHTMGSSKANEYIFHEYDDVISKIQQDERLLSLIREIKVELHFSGIIMGDDTDSVNYIGRGSSIAFGNPATQRRASYGVNVDSLVDEDIVAGRALSTEDDTSIILGRGIATQLKADIDSYLTVLSTTEYGTFNVLDAILQGIVDPLSKEYSDVILKSNLSFAQSLIDSEGVHTIIILLQDTANTELAAEMVSNIIQEENWDLDLLRWHELADFYQAVKTWFTGLIFFIRVMLIIVVIFFILNTINMSITERFSEIGTLRSIGNTRSDILQLFLSEGVLLGFFSAVLSIILGLYFCLMLTDLNIMTPPPPGQSRPVPLFLIYYPEHYYMLYDIGIILLLASFVASYIPSLRAGKLRIVECLRHE